MENLDSFEEFLLSFFDEKSKKNLKNNLIINGEEFKNK
jgi:hypothetical protein